MKPSSSPPPAQADLPVRERIMAAGKKLFASQGFENTSTASIVKAAQTSESQLFKHFHDKEGLLEAIFQDGWNKMSFVLTASRIAHSPQEKLKMILELMINALASDPEMRDLMLLEGRRIRKVGGRILVTNGYAEFSQFIEGIVKDLQTQGRLVPELSVAAVRTILVGTFESMMREQVLSYRGVSGASLKTEEIRAGFEVVLKAMLR
jgi:AcrR family transcriptional regulator